MNFGEINLNAEVHQNDPCRYCALIPRYHSPDQECPISTRSVVGWTGRKYHPENDMVYKRAAERMAYFKLNRKWYPEYAIMC